LVRQNRHKAILFDCDGVLVDSEPISLEVLRDCLDDWGWPLSFEACLSHFLGRPLENELDLIEAHSGRRPDEAWIAEFRRQRDIALSKRVQATPGMHEALEEIYPHFEGRIACASGADRRKIELQLTRTGLMRWFEGRVFSGHEVPRTKPAPDVYLAAAKFLGVEAQACLVIEDSPTGVQAGIAAGAKVLGFLPATQPEGLPHMLLAAGATEVFDDMKLLRQFAITG